MPCSRTQHGLTRVGLDTDKTLTALVINSITQALIVVLKSKSAEKMMKQKNYKKIYDQKSGPAKTNFGQKSGLAMAVEGLDFLIIKRFLLPLGTGCYFIVALPGAFHIIIIQHTRFI